MSGACKVPLNKVRDYLLNPDHADGGPKSAFFEAYGFERVRCELLAEALVDHFQTHPPIAISDTAYGRKYVVRGPLKAADGWRPIIQTVWIMLDGNDVPIFVTAVPRKPDPETV